MQAVAVHAIIFLVFAALGTAFIELGIPAVGVIFFLAALWFVVIPLMSVLRKGRTH